MTTGGVSLIVPVRNEAATLASTLAGFRSVMDGADELIVVDGGSRDDSVAIARQWADRTLTVAPGRARQMNAGAAQATGAWLWFVHADTGLERKHRECFSHLDPQVVWGRFDVRLSGQRPLFRLISGMMNWRSRLTGIATGDQGIFVRRALFMELGGYPDQLLMEDIALSGLLRQHRRPACLRPPLLTSSRRWENRGAWRTIWHMWSLRYRYWRGASPQTLYREYYDHSE